MTLPEIIFLSLFVIIAPLLGYQFFLGLLALKAKKFTSFEAKTFRKFAIIVPAHNEEQIIAKTLYSLSGLIYPKKLYDIFVIADNCTDNTAALAKTLGVNVLERANKTQKGKGYALRWAFDQILSHKNAYDALIVVDADSLISGNYLEVMNYYMERGSRVIQSSDLVLSQAGNWSVEATRIGFLLFNYVKPLGRKKLGFNMGLRGNGMCFERNVLKDVPWEAWSLTEDVEYGLMLLLKGIRIDFAPEATVLAQMPLEASNAETQRSRWELGRLQIVRRYASKFLVESIKKRSAAFFDVFLDLITPPFVNMMLLTAGILAVGVLSWILGIISFLYILLWGLLFLGGVFYLLLGLYIGNADKNLYKSLIYLPKYIYWKLRVYFKALKKGKEENWIRTHRDSV